MSSAGRCSSVTSTSRRTARRDRHAPHGRGRQGRRAAGARAVERGAGAAAHRRRRPRHAPADLARRPLGGLPVGSREGRHAGVRAAPGRRRGAAGDRLPARRLGPRLGCPDGSGLVVLASDDDAPGQVGPREDGPADGAGRAPHRLARGRIGAPGAPVARARRAAGRRRRAGRAPPDVGLVVGLPSAPGGRRAPRAVPRRPACRRRSHAEPAAARRRRSRAARPVELPAELPGPIVRFARGGRRRAGRRRDGVERPSDDEPQRLWRVEPDGAAAA